MGLPGDRSPGRIRSYSNSKSCSELVTHSYRNSFFADGRTAISTARAGNVIGGGDFAADRIIPDCIRAALEKKPVPVRNPHSTRPFQHVLEPLYAYLMIAAAQYEDGRLPDTIMWTGRRGLRDHRRAGGSLLPGLGAKARPGRIISREAPTRPVS